MIRIERCPRALAAARLCFGSYPQGQRNERSSHRSAGRSARGGQAGGRGREGGKERREIQREGSGNCLLNLPFPLAGGLINGDAAAVLLRRDGFTQVRNSVPASWNSRGAASSLPCRRSRLGTPRRFFHRNAEPRAQSPERASTLNPRRRVFLTHSGAGPIRETFRLP